MITRRSVAVLALGATAGIGAAVGVAVVGSSPGTTRTVTVAARTTSPIRTVTKIRSVQRVRTVERVRTSVKTVTASGPEAPGASIAAGRPTQPAEPAPRPQRFSGSGGRVLGTITVPEPGATMRWTNSAGRFRLLFNGTGVAVDSTARGGQLDAPAQTYRGVTVRAPGHWTVSIG